MNAGVRGALSAITLKDELATCALFMFVAEVGKTSGNTAQYRSPAAVACNLQSIFQWQIETINFFVRRDDVTFFRSATSPQR